MKVSIIAQTGMQIASLSKTIVHEGFSITQTELHNDSSKLNDLLSKVVGDVLIIDFGEFTLKENLLAMENLIALEKFISNQPSTSVLLLSKVKNAEVLSTAMQIGVREVLLDTATGDELASTLKRMSLRRQITSEKSVSRASTVAFLSCKGGSGATFLATNFAYILAQELDKKTIFLDLDLHCGDAVYYVAPGPSKSDITEITRQIDRLDTKLLASSVLHVAPNFDLLSAPEESDVTDAMSPSQLEKLIDIVSVNYEMVVLDLDRVIHPLTAQALDMADTVFIVMQNLLPYLRDAKRIVAKFRALGYEDKKIRLVVNRYEKNDIIDIAKIEKVVGLKVSYTIRSSFQDIAKAINTGVPIIQVNKSNVVVSVLRQMANEFQLEKPQKKSSWLHRLMES